MFKDLMCFREERPFGHIDHEGALDLRLTREPHPFVAIPSVEKGTLGKGLLLRRGVKSDDAFAATAMAAAGVVQDNSRPRRDFDEIVAFLRFDSFAGRFKADLMSAF
jgi:hypothetical protein